MEKIYDTSYLRGSFSFIMWRVTFTACVAFLSFFATNTRPKNQDKIIRLPCLERQLACTHCLNRLSDRNAHPPHPHLEALQCCSGCLHHHHCHHRSLSAPGSPQLGEQAKWSPTPLPKTGPAGWSAFLFLYKGAHLPMI